MKPVADVFNDFMNNQHPETDNSKNKDKIERLDQLLNEFSDLQVFFRELWLLLLQINLCEEKYKAKANKIVFWSSIKFLEFTKHQHSRSGS